MSCSDWKILIYYSLGFLVLHLVADTLIRFEKPRYSSSFSLASLLFFFLCLRCFFLIYIIPFVSK